MNILSIKATKKQKHGTNVSRRATSNKKIPGVLYGKNKHIAFTLNLDDVLKISKKPGFHKNVVCLIIDTKHYQVKLQDAQYHPTQNQCRHLDFVMV